MANIESWGITEKGFYCPTEAEILAEKIKYAKELFGEDISVSEKTPLGKLLRIDAAHEQKLFETAECVYYSFSPVTATGVSLDRALAFIRASRNPATSAKHLIRVYGDKDYEIKAGELFRSRAGVVFYATESKVIDTPQTEDEDNMLYYTEICVQCTTPGEFGNVSNISDTVNVNTHISSIQYVKQLTTGENTESDAAARERYNTIIDGLGSNTISSIIANVMRVNGVHACIIKNNITDEDIEISEDLILKSATYAVIVYADRSLAEKIAEAIFEKQPFGILQSGLEVVTVMDVAGEYHNVKFSFVEEKAADITVKCTITSEFSADGKEQIADNIKEYVNNLAIGRPLIYSHLFKEIHSVAGVDDVTELTINGATSNITVSDIEIIKAGEITITTTEV